MQRPRLVLLALAALSLASSVAAGQAYYTESPVTLQFVLQHTGPVVRTGPDEAGLIVDETTVESRRLGNAELLQEMVSRSLIPSVNGHLVVAVWANWPDEKPFAGSAFRLFVRKVGMKQKALVAVPPEVLALSPEDWLHERDILRKSKAIKSGQENFEAYSKLKFNFAGRNGILLGHDLGGGVFKAPAKGNALQYLPKPGALSLEGTAGMGVCSAEIQFGTARFIHHTEFKPKALPPATKPGGYYGYRSVAMLRSADLQLAHLYVPPYVHYFSPLEVSLTLKTQETVPGTEKGRERTRIASTEISSADVLRGLLQTRGIEDVDGWRLYLHARSDKYQSLESCDLAIAHLDGRIFALGGAAIDLSTGSAKAARYEYRGGTYASGEVTQLAHATLQRNWPLPGAPTARLLVTGPAEIRLRPTAPNTETVPPASAELDLFGTYSIDYYGGLAEMSLSVAAPLAQSEIPAGWNGLYPPYSPSMNPWWGIRSIYSREVHTAAD